MWTAESKIFIYYPTLYRTRLLTPWSVSFVSSIFINWKKAAEGRGQEETFVFLYIIVDNKNSRRQEPACTDSRQPIVKFWRVLQVSWWRAGIGYCKKILTAQKLINPTNQGFFLQWRVSTSLNKRKPSENLIFVSFRKQKAGKKVWIRFLIQTGYADGSQSAKLGVDREVPGAMSESLLMLTVTLW